MSLLSRITERSEPLGSSSSERSWRSVLPSPIESYYAPVTSQPLPHPSAHRIPHDGHDRPYSTSSNRRNTRNRRSRERKHRRRNPVLPRQRSVSTESYGRSRSISSSGIRRPQFYVRKSRLKRPHRVSTGSRQKSSSARSARSTRYFTASSRSHSAIRRQRIQYETQPYIPVNPFKADQKPGPTPKLATHTGQYGYAYDTMEVSHSGHYPTLHPIIVAAHSSRNYRSRRRSASDSRVPHSSVSRSQSRGRTRSPKPHMQPSPIPPKWKRSHSWPPSSSYKDANPPVINVNPLHRQQFAQHARPRSYRTHSRSSSRPRSQLTLPYSRSPKGSYRSHGSRSPNTYHYPPTLVHHYQHPVRTGTVPGFTPDYKRSRVKSRRSWPQAALYFISHCLVLATETLPREVYLYTLLRIPVLYYSRVARVFEDAQLSLPDIKQMYITSDNEVVQYNWDMIQHTSGHGVNYPTLSRFKRSWDDFIDSITREWQVQNVVAVLLLSAVLTMLQIDSISNDPVARTAAIFALICSLMSLLYGCIYMSHFAGMKRLYKAASWAEEAQNTHTFIFWNVWIFLAMPTIWLAWSMIMFVTSVLSYVWRSGTTLPDPSPLTPEQALGPRIAVSAVFCFGILYFILILKTLSRYGSTMDEEWSSKIHRWRTEYHPSHAPMPHIPPKSPHIYMMPSRSHTRSQSPVFHHMAPSLSSYSSSPRLTPPVIIPPRSSASPPSISVLPPTIVQSKRRRRSLSPLIISSQPIPVIPPPIHVEHSSDLLAPAASPSAQKNSPGSLSLEDRAPSALLGRRDISQTSQLAPIVDRPYPIYIVVPPGQYIFPPDDAYLVGRPPHPTKRGVLRKTRPAHSFGRRPSLYELWLSATKNTPPYFSVNSSSLEGWNDTFPLQSLVIWNIGDIVLPIPRAVPRIEHPKWMVQQDWERFVEDLRLAYADLLTPLRGRVEYRRYIYISDIIRVWNSRYFYQFGVQVSIVAPENVDTKDVPTLLSSCSLALSKKSSAISMELELTPFFTNRPPPSMVPAHLEGYLPFQNFSLAPGPYLSYLRQRPHLVPSAFGFPPILESNYVGEVIYKLPAGLNYGTAIPPMRATTGPLSIPISVWHELYHLLTFAFTGDIPIMNMSRIQRHEMRWIIVEDIIQCWNQAFFHPRVLNLRIYPVHIGAAGVGPVSSDTPYADVDAYTVSLHRRTTLL